LLVRAGPRQVEPTAVDAEDEPTVDPPVVGQRSLHPQTQRRHDQPRQFAGSPPQQLDERLIAAGQLPLLVGQLTDYLADRSKSLAEGHLVRPSP
jgi:hypothetical protein